MNIRKPTKDDILMAIRTNILASRELQRQKDIRMNDIVGLLGKLGIYNTDSIKTDAENADDLGQAINCFIDYGEYNIDDLMQEIEAAADPDCLL